MQGVLGYSANVSALGSSAITSNDLLQYNAGQEIYVKNSEVRLRWTFEGYKIKKPTLY